MHILKIGPLPIEKLWKKAKSTKTILFIEEWKIDGSAPNQERQFRSNNFLSIPLTSKSNPSTPLTNPANNTITMGKRKEIKDGDVAMGGTDPNVDGDSDEDMEIVNVDFEWFDFQEIDFHGLKHLIRQLFDVDSQDIDLSALSDLIISQPHLGSTVKTDGKESDPYAFLTVLNLQEHSVCLHPNPAFYLFFFYFLPR